MRKSLASAVAAVALALVSAGPSLAATCSADCECSPCKPYFACTIFCAAGSGAFCTDGACGSSLQAKCCCTEPDPNLGVRFRCAYTSCGLFASDNCTLWDSARAPATVGRVLPLKEPSWSLVEYTIAPSGRVLEMRERFTSPGGSGKAGKSPAELAAFGPGHYEIFSFSPPEGSKPTRGRKVSLRDSGILPFEAAQGISGQIAFRIESPSNGSPLLKDVLFSSNLSLNRWLPEILDLIAIDSPGETDGTPVDVVFMTLKEGQVHTMTYNSYVF